ncbi:MAG: tol-pal system protein YbgF [Candidatus Latescibacterota bacterium]
MKRRDSIIKSVSCIVLAGAVLTISPSCATKKFMLTLQEETMAKNREIESRLTVLEQSVAVVDSMAREQHRLMMGTRAIVGNQSQSQQDNIQGLSARLDNIYHMMNELNQKLQAIQLYGGLEAPAPQSSAAPDTASSGREVTTGQPSFPSVAPLSNVDPKEVYDAALADVNNLNYSFAESRFMAFLIQFPRHELAPNAQYWLGEVDYAQKKYDLAISEFEKVIENYPQSEKVPASLLKIAFAQIELGKKSTARGTLQKLIKEYPKSEEAKLARAKVKQLGR